MQHVLSSALTQSGSVFSNPSQAFEFVSDDDDDHPSIISSGDGDNSKGVVPTRLSPRICPLQDPRSLVGKPPLHDAGTRPIIGDLRLVSAPSTGKTLSEECLRLQTLKQRIEAFNEMAASKISTGSIPEVPSIPETMSPASGGRTESRNGQGKKRLWRKPQVMVCMQIPPSELDSTTPRYPAGKHGKNEIKSEPLRESSQSTSRARSFGIFRLAKKFAKLRNRLRQGKTDLEGDGAASKHGGNICEMGSVAKNGQQDSMSASIGFRHPARPSIVTRRQTVAPSSSIEQHVMTNVGTSSSGAVQRGFCDTWDCLTQTRALRQQAKGKCPHRGRPSRPHFGEYRRPQRQSFLQTWHGEIGEASSPVQRRNADVMQSLSEINAAREVDCLEIENFGKRIGANERLGRLTFEGDNDDDQECADSLHLQIPVTPNTAICTQSYCEWNSLDEAENGMQWLGDEPSNRPDETCSIDPVTSDAYEGGALERYRSDRLMPQDPMLSQKLLFDTLFESCASYEVQNDSSIVRLTPPNPGVLAEGTCTDPMSSAECRALSGCWYRDEELSDRPEDVCDAAALNWLIKKSGKHSKHLKIDVRRGCIAVTGQIQGGFDHTQILHFSSRGHEVQRCDGRPGSMKIWVEAISRGFRERNSWGSPQAGAKMDEYELSEDALTLIVTTHVTFKMGRNCRLRSIFRRITSSCKTGSK